MKLSICICTRDRPALLEQALTSLAAMESSGVEWEVVVVDNGSQPSRLASLGDEFPGLDVQLIAESRGGLSIARNAAIEHSRGEGLIFVDDDVTVPRAWLRAYALGFERYPAAAFFGGPIFPCVSDPAFQGKLRTMEQVMPGAVGLLDPGLPEGPLSPDGDVLPWGANMAFRRTALGSLRFDSRRGRRPDAQFASGEETALLQEMQTTGAQGVWLPATRLNHHVGAERCNSQYLKGYAHGIGWVGGRDAALEQRESPDGWRGWAVSEYRSRRWAKWTTPPWARLEDRWAALRDLAVIEGLRDGFEETMQELKRGASS